ncbi:MAG TPA: hypothetical protein PLN85_01440 [archaeon]|nr:hypothetical protein [archaeon]HRT02640.1 hypothetical protein [Candidatus Diapherotrites archaeon]
MEINVVQAASKLAHKALIEKCEKDLGINEEDLTIEDASGEFYYKEYIQEIFNELYDEYYDIIVSCSELTRLEEDLKSFEKTFE